MGEVFRAFDLKLRVEVALKAVRVERASERARELLRGEVRTAREVVSPNVCRIFDLVVEDGQELVSMESPIAYRSRRSATSGSSFDARPAGIQQARRARTHPERQPVHSSSGSGTSGVSLPFRRRAFCLPSSSR